MIYRYEEKTVTLDDALIAAYDQRNDRPFSESDIRELVLIGRIADGTEIELAKQVEAVIKEELAVWEEIEKMEEMKETNVFIALRKTTGLSQAKFAAQFGIPVATLRDWEQGRRNPPSYVESMLTRAVEDYMDGSL